MSENFKFPSIEDLQGQPPAGVKPEDYSPDQWEGILFDIKWGRLKDLREQNIATPETLWWQFLCDTISKAIIQTKTDREKYGYTDTLPDDKFDKFVNDICKEILNYFHRRLVVNKLDGAFNTIYQCDAFRISKSQYETLRGIESGLRKALGHEAKPGKEFSLPPKRQKTEDRRSLVQAIQLIFKGKKYNTGLSQGSIAKYIKKISESCNIEQPTVESIRTRYLLKV